jgi:hypothetical protein
VKEDVWKAIKQKKKDDELGPLKPKAILEKQAKPVVKKDKSGYKTIDPYT